MIFKKYSLLGGVEDFASHLCETMSRSTGSICAVTDRDTIIAVAGGGKRELSGKRISPELEQIMESRRIYQFAGEGQALPVSDSTDKLAATVAAPILAEGDLLGLVLFISPVPAAATGDAEYKLAQTIAAFLGRHMESWTPGEGLPGLLPVHTSSFMIRPTIQPLPYQAGRKAEVCRPVRSPEFRQTTLSRAHAAGNFL